MKSSILSILILSLLLCVNSFAQTKQPEVTAAETDVMSMDAIIKALYETISGDAGEKRDWNRFRSLFHSGARLIPTGKRPTGEVGSRVLTVEDYIKSAEPFFEKEGFYESELGRKTEQFGNIAHIFSTYQSKKKADDEKPFTRGINSIQLLWDGKRWWVMTIFWDSETAEKPIPKDYLQKDKRKKWWIF